VKQNLECFQDVLVPAKVNIRNLLSFWGFLLAAAPDKSWDNY
jgi:hypothetical protein